MTSVTVVVPMTIRRRGGRKQIIGPDGALVQTSGDAAGVVETRGEPALVKALARAFRWRRLLDEGQHASIREMAFADKVDVSQIARLLRLTLLAPDIVEAILDGYDPDIAALRLGATTAADWSTQREALASRIVSPRRGGC